MGVAPANQQFTGSATSNIYVKCRVHRLHSSPILIAIIGSSCHRFDSRGHRQWTAEEGFSQVDLAFWIFSGRHEIVMREMNKTAKAAA